MNVLTVRAVLSGLAILAVSSVVTVAQATALRFDMIDARFYDPVGGNPDTTDTGFGDPVSINWSNPANDPVPSGYDFDPALSPLTAMPAIPFKLGDFTHRNQPITSGTQITSVKLDVRGTITAIADDLSESNIGQKTFSFLVDHDETPNSANPCPYGNAADNANGCADQVSISTIVGTDSFNAFGQHFTLNIVGFTLPSDNTMVSPTFISPEDGNNQRALWGQFDVTQVPEPGTIGILGLGLLGLGAMRRRRSA